MKKLVYIFFAAVLLCSCGSKSSGKGKPEAKDSVTVNADSVKTRAIIIFPDGKYHNFGVQTELKMLTHDFIFENHGDGPLVIDYIETHCSCTRAKYPKRPVMPGEMDTISVTYDHGVYKSGSFNKSCIIHSNAEYTLELTVSGEFELGEE
jgi:hypothetical protein